VQEISVGEWEYRKIDLNQLPRKTEDIDLLCEAGLDGWEVVTILENHVAYLKRQGGDSASGLVADTTNVAVGSGYAAKVKYRDSTTNETWSGRGRMATWLKSKQDAGEDIDEYLV
jgi:H-NS histone family protein